MATVSVIIPVYNVEPYIARCAQSLFEQSMQDLEYIFVDDCTPDRSIDVMLEVLEAFPERKNQVKVIHNEHNLGLARARLAGLSHASGEYIAHCDSDDAVHADAYRLMYEKAKEENLDIVTCDLLVYGPKRNRVQSQVTEAGMEVASFLRGNVWSNVICRLFKRDLWEDMILPKGDMWEDMVFSIQAFSKAHRCGNIPTPLYYYYRRGNSISGNPSLESAMKRWRQVSANAHLIIDYLNDNPHVKWNEADMVTFKYRCRDYLLPFIQRPDCYRLWRNTFPEIEPIFLRTKGVSWNIKVWFVIIHLRMYYPVKSVTRAIRSLLSR